MIISRNATWAHVPFGRFPAAQSKPSEEGEGDDNHWDRGKSSEGSGSALRYQVLEAMRYLVELRRMGLSFPRPSRCIEEGSTTHIKHWCHSEKVSSEPRQQHTGGWRDLQNISQDRNVPTSGSHTCGRAKVEGLRSARRTSSRSEAELERTLENDELCLYSSLYLLACYRAYIGLLPPWRSLSALRDSRNLQKHSTFESQGTHFASGRHYGQDFGSLLCLLSNNN